jgi:hypothetical protein
MVNSPSTVLGVEVYIKTKKQARVRRVLSCTRVLYSSSGCGCGCNFLKRLKKQWKVLPSTGINLVYTRVMDYWVLSTTATRVVVLLVLECSTHSFEKTRAVHRSTTSVVSKRVLVSIKWEVWTRWSSVKMLTVLLQTSKNFLSLCEYS